MGTLCLAGGRPSCRASSKALCSWCAEGCRRGSGSWPQRPTHFCILSPGITSVVCVLTCFPGSPGVELRALCTSARAQPITKLCSQSVFLCHGCFSSSNQCQKDLPLGLFFFSFKNDVCMCKREWVCRGMHV